MPNDAPFKGKLRAVTDSTIRDDLGTVITVHSSLKVAQWVARRDRIIRCVNAYPELVEACDVKGLEIVLDGLRSDVADGLCGASRVEIFASRIASIVGYIDRVNEALALADPATKEADHAEWRTV